jgi:hypothetical protein
MRGHDNRFNYCLQYYFLWKKEADGKSSQDKGWKLLITCMDESNS